MKRTVYTEDHEAFRRTVRAFLESEVVPVYGEWIREGTPRDLFRKLGKLEVMGFGIPEDYGGSGPVSYKYQAIISEETARLAVDLGHYMVTTGIVLPYLLNLASGDQRDRWFGKLATGELVLAIAMTEPGTGSDLAGIRTTAKLSGDGTHYVLNGAKTFITGARNAELTIVVARTSAAPAGDRRGGLSLLVVENGSEGFTIGRKLPSASVRPRPRPRGPRSGSREITSVSGQLSAFASRSSRTRNSFSPNAPRRQKRPKR